MYNVKVFNCSSFPNFTFKSSFSSEIFKVGFSVGSAVKINRGLLNIEREKLLLNFNVVVISLVLNKKKTIKPINQIKASGNDVPKKEFLQHSRKIVVLKFKH